MYKQDTQNTSKNPKIMGEEDVLFKATTVHLDHITTALNCLVPFGVKEDVLIIIDEDGLSFASEKSHIIKIHLFLSKDLFTMYNYDSSKAPFEKVCVKLNHILDSVNVGNNKDSDDVLECTLSYNGDGTPFIFIFEDSMITERMEYSTYLIRDMDIHDGLRLNQDNIEYECIIQGDLLNNALQDLKELDSKEIYLYVSAKKNSKPQFSFIFKNEQLGVSRITFPSERAVIEKIEFNQEIKTLYKDESISFFDFQTFDKISKSVKVASKVLFRKDVYGVLSVNILSKTNNISLTKFSSRNPNSIQQNNNNNRSKLNFLPRNYSGIVIDITMIEKDSDSDFHDLIDLMNRTENTPNNEIPHETQHAFKKKRKLDDLNDDQLQIHTPSLQTTTTTMKSIPPTQNRIKSKNQTLFF